MVNEMQKMQTAVRAFELEFDATPGLMKDAYDYFGDECGVDSINIYNGCNGDTSNDRCLATTNCSVGNRYWADYRRFPIHLALSGIYPDMKYVSDTNTQTDCFEYLPDSPTGNYLWFSSETPDRIYMYDRIIVNPNRDAVNTCDIGNPVPSVSPRFMKAIDEKMDDGNGRRGNFTAQPSPSNENSYSHPPCMDSDGIYNITNDSEECGLRFRLK